jgi:DNA helicase HerA-like ATPase
LIVVEEAHLWASKDLPKEVARFLDGAVGLFRKKGVGVMLVSQKISDFDPAIARISRLDLGQFRGRYICSWS